MGVYEETLDASGDRAQWPLLHSDHPWEKVGKAWKLGFPHISNS